MCLFITAVLGRGAQIEKVRQFAKKYDWPWRPMSNQHLLEQLSAGESIFTPTRGPCDCETALGSGLGSEPDQPSRRDLARLRKKGWSEAKIRDWYQAKGGGRQQKLHDAQRSEFAAWQAFIPEVINSGATPSLGVLLHWYKRGVSDESFAIRRRQTLPLTETDLDILWGLERDILYSFER